MQVLENNLIWFERRILKQEGSVGIETDSTDIVVKIEGLSNEE